MSLDPSALLAQPAEAYMDAAQTDFFRNLLQGKMQELVARIQGHEESITVIEQVADEGDAASAGEQRSLTLRIVARERAELAEIKKALTRIAEGEYGFCEMTGEEIGLKRLLLQPTALHTVEAKTRLEKQNQHLRVEAS